MDEFKANPGRTQRDYPALFSRVRRERSRGFELSARCRPRRARFPQPFKEAIADLEYLTRDEDFRNFGRGKPPIHKLSSEKLREVGLHRDTWQLEVLPDPESDPKVEKPLFRKNWGQRSRGRIL